MVLVQKVMRKIVISLILIALFSTPVYAQTYSINGYTYVPLWSVCRENDIEFLWDSFGRVATLKKDNVEAKLRINSDKILVGDRLKDIGPPVKFYKGMVVIPKSFGQKGILKIFKSTPVKVAKTITTPKSKSKNKIRTIVIDPGHGGKDPGAIGRYGLKEKTVVLDIAKRLKRILSARGINVVMTRSSDKFIPLWKRADIANKKGADFFISVHANAFRKRWVKGFEVYHFSEATDSMSRAIEAAENNAVKFEEDSINRYSRDVEAIVCDLKLHEDKKESFGLAYTICRQARKKLYTRNRGVKGAKFHVLKNAQMPAVLVEVGFISNKGEEKLLKTSGYREKVANAIAGGVLAYKKEYERTNGFAQ